MGSSGSKNKKAEAASSSAQSSGQSIGTAIASRAGGVAFNTALYSVEQVGAGLRLGRQFFTEPSFQKSVINYSRIFLSQFLLIAAVNTLNYWAQQWLTPDESEEEYNPMVYWGLWMTATVLDMAVKTYTFREIAPTAVKTTLTNLQLNQAKRKIKTNNEGCDQGCKASTVRDFGLTALENVSGDVLLGSLWGIGRLGFPVPDSVQWLSWLLVYGNRIARNSRIADEHCREHQVIATGNSLALGLGYWGTHKGLMFLLDSLPVRLPWIYALLLDQMLMNFHVVGSRHLRSPYVKMEDSNIPVLTIGKYKIPLDPIASYEKLFVFITSELMKKAKEILPGFFSNDNAQFPWETVLNRLKMELAKFRDDPRFERVYSFVMPMLEQSYSVLIPRMFKSGNNFINDPVIASIWPDCRDFLVAILDGILNLQNEHPFLHSMLYFTPKNFLKQGLKNKFGMHKELSSKLIDAYFSKKARGYIREFRDKLVDLQLNEEVKQKANAPVTDAKGQQFIESRVNAAIAASTLAASSISVVDTKDVPLIEDKPEAPKLQQSTACSSFGLFRTPDNAMNQLIRGGELKTDEEQEQEEQEAQDKPMILLKEEVLDPNGASLSLLQRTSY